MSSSAAALNITDHLRYLQLKSDCFHGLESCTGCFHTENRKSVKVCDKQSTFCGTNDFFFSKIKFHDVILKN